MKKRFKLYKSGKVWLRAIVIIVGIVSGLCVVNTDVTADTNLQSVMEVPHSQDISQSDDNIERFTQPVEISKNKNTINSSVNGSQPVTPQGQTNQPSVQNGWSKNEQGQLVYYQEGHSLTGRKYINLPSIPATNVQSDNNWYLLDNGIAQSGVQQWAGSYYYFDPVTYLRVDNDYRQSQWGDWYLFGNDGRIQSGVQQWAGTYYYFDPNTYLRVDNDYRQSQWGDWYMFGPDGRIVTRVYQWADTYYYFDPVTYLRVDNDYRQSQWGDWYLFGNDGRIQSGVQQWAGTYYYFDPNTYLRVDNDYRQSQWGDWYMFGPDGRIVSGVWNWYGKTYYFDPRTYLKVTNAWADGEYYGYTGARIDGFNYKNATYLVDSVLHKTDEQGQLTNIFDPKKFPNLASLSVDGDLSGITKDNKKTVKLKLTQIDGSQLDAWATIKWQGNSSLAWPKKGYRIKLFKDQELTERYKIELPGTDYKTNSFNLKGCFNDSTMSLNIVNSRLFTEVTKSRSGLKDSIVNKMPNYGQVNGIPVEFGINGLDQGLYVLETYHEDKLYNLNDKKTNNIALSANYHAPCTAFDEMVTVDDLRDTVFSNTSPAKVNQQVADHFNKLYELAKADERTYQFLEEKYFDVPAAIDYLAFSFAINNSDGLRKNIMYVSKDNGKWTIIPYDLDTTWDTTWDNSKQDLTLNFEDTLRENDNKLLLNFYAHHKQEIINRYKELSSDVLSSENINSLFKDWFDSIGNDAYTHNDDLWANIGVDHHSSISLNDITKVVNERLMSVAKYWKI
ncbi:MAG: KxYKxGKxW signal peptide domain-containing protein [Lactobacillus sp.]|nr:KxYKxGKxW signal peptide domain-containing protein [Lactobacillus sp.]